MVLYVPGALTSDVGQVQRGRKTVEKAKIKSCLLHQYTKVLKFSYLTLCPLTERKGVEGRRNKGRGRVRW